MSHDKRKEAAWRFTVGSGQKLNPVFATKVNARIMETGETENRAIESVLQDMIVEARGQQDALIANRAIFGLSERSVALKVADIKAICEATGNAALAMVLR